jgi:hypothetical protein
MPSPCDRSEISRTIPWRITDQSNADDFLDDLNGIIWQNDNVLSMRRHFYQYDEIIKIRNKYKNCMANFFTNNYNMKHQTERTFNLGISLPGLALWSGGALLLHYLALDNLHSCLAIFDVPDVHHCAELHCYITQQDWAEECIVSLDLSLVNHGR